MKIFLPNCSQKHIIFSSNLQQIHKIAAFFTCNLWKWWYNKTCKQTDDCLYFFTKSGTQMQRWDKNVLYEEAVGERKI